MKTNFIFPDTTLLITHYNRSSSLERLLSRLRELSCNFGAIIVSDDASDTEHLVRLEQLQRIYGLELVTAPVNKGLANCLNKGQDAVKTPYTLYIQEDFVPSAFFPQRLADARLIMNDHADIDYIRFWSHYRFPTLKPFGKGFSETVYNPWIMNHLNFFMYSDNPHLRRSNFFSKFGRYIEGVKADVAEHNMAIRFIQKKGKGLFYDQYDTLFAHDQLDHEPSTANRADWRQSSHPLYLVFRSLYLKYKCLKCMYQVKYQA